MTAWTHEMLWNALPQPALVVDAAGLISDLNNAAQVFLSMSAAHLRGRNLRRYAGATSTLAAIVEQARGGPVSLAQYDVELSWADQPPRLVDLYAAPVQETDDVLVMIRPRAMAEKMDRSLSHRSAARSVVGMAEMLAHEIKNPLAGISGAAQLLAMSLPDADQELTSLIREETERIGRLIDRVEQFGDIRPTVREPVNIHDVITRAKRSAAAGFAAHVRFVEEFDPSLPPAAGDAGGLMQVLLNLIKNAAEAVPPVGGIIVLRSAFRPGVKLALPGGRRESLPLQISVSDNGHGVPKDLKHDLFEPFVTSKPNGSGLGLALVSKIIADHGGVAEFESDPGATTFRVLLPVWAGPDPARGRADGR
jgi:two-component system nitrogen regulation sensor histidine kinase GlnL